MEIFWSDLKPEVREDIAEGFGETAKGFAIRRNLDFKAIAVTHTDII